MDEEHVKCLCQSELFDDEETVEEIKPKVIEIDFGQVTVNTEASKTVNLAEHAPIKDSKFAVTRESSSLYQVFKLGKCQVEKMKKNQVLVKIHYKPIIANESNVEIFRITTEEVYRIFVKGECIGPVVSITLKTLQFLISPSKTTKQRMTEIKNTSAVDANFQFDYDCNDKNIFQVEPNEGHLGSNKHLFIKVTFTPKKQGSYSQKLSCLISNHEPIVLDIFGYYNVTNKLDASQIHFVSYPMKTPIGYQGYFSEVPLLEEAPGPITLSQNYVDFGRKLPIASGSDDTCKAKLLSIRNNLEDEVKIVWPSDDNFHVCPKILTIPALHQATFECFFQPTAAYKLFFRKSTALVFWHYSSTLEAKKIKPIPVTVRFIGHSFPANEFWLPNVEIQPPILILPPTLAGYASFGMLLLRNHSPLPAIFKIIPSEKTSIYVKPMVGLIRKYQIVMVRLNTKENEEKLFGERWFLEINGLENRQQSFYIKGQSAIPRVTLGNNNKIKFACVQPGSQDTVILPLKNTSVLKFQFNLDPMSEFLKITPQKGVLAPNDEISVSFCYTGCLQAPNRWVVNCHLQTLRKGVEIIGEVVTVTFDVEARCAYSQLCATPNNYDFGELCFGTEVQTEFYLFNFGESKLHFQLNILKDSNNVDEFHLEPSIGDVFPKGKIKIELKGTTKTIGFNEITINYTTPNILVDNGPVDVFKVVYTCVYPIIQIEEIVEQNVEHLFTKLHIWEMLEIDKLNVILQEICSGEQKTINLRLPEVPVGDLDYNVTLLVRNTSNHTVELNLKREKMCDCELIPSSDFITLRKAVFECPHRDILTMSLSNNTVYAHSTQFLTIKIEYLIPDETTMAYVLDLGHERRVLFSFEVFAIPQNVGKISKYSAGYEMKLEDVFVGEKLPVKQTFWWYNNTGSIVHFLVHREPLRDLCHREGFKVLYNEESSVFVQPYSMRAMIFLFHPIEAKTYQVTVPVTINEKIIELKITGSGTIDRHYSGIKLTSKMPPTSKHYTPKALVTLSVDYMVLEPLPIWSKVERIFFIKNVTKDRVIEYKWGQCGINKVVIVEPLNNPNGFLRPNEAHAVRIEIRAFSLPAVTVLNLPCQIQDYTELVRHRTLKDKFYKKMKVIDQEFDLTDKGYQKPPHYVFMIPAPPIRYVSISLGVHIVNLDGIKGYEYFSKTPTIELKIGAKNILEKFNFHFAKKIDNPIHGDGNELKQEPGEIKIEHADFMKCVMDCLISNFVFSDLFPEILKISCEEVPPFYHQFTMTDMVTNKEKMLLSNEDICEFRNKEIVDFCNKLESSEMSETMIRFINDAIAETFKTSLNSDNAEEIEKYVLDLLRKIAPTCECDEK